MLDTGNEEGTSYQSVVQENISLNQGKALKNKWMQGYEHGSDLGSLFITQGSVLLANKQVS